MRLLCFALLVPALLGGCNSPFQEHRLRLREHYAQGRFDLVAAALEDPSNSRIYGEKNEVLWRLDRGAAALALGDATRAIEELSVAEAIIDRRREAGLHETLGTLLFNDLAAPYLAEPYEDMYINVLKMLAQLTQGNIVGGATVEARRMTAKANLLRDRYLRLLPATRREAQEHGLAPGEDLPPTPEGFGAVAAVNEQGEFVESPLGLYLTALTFLHSGERENQRVAARRLSETLRLQEEIVGPVRAEAFDGLGDLAPDDARLLLVAFAGRGPSKQIARFGPIPIADYPIYIELPVLRWYPSEASSVRATLTPAQGGGDATVVTLGLVEQIGRVAHENHRRQMPLVYTRAFARATIRALAGRAAIRAVRRSTSNDLLVLGAYIGALAIPAITEKADTRAWAMLPGEAFVAAAGPEPGEYSVLLEWLSPTGGVVFSKRGRVVVPEEGMATVLEHYWR